ncbi:MAG: DUF4159 domain-containing protein [Rhodothermaceae bacterium]
MKKNIIIFVLFLFSVYAQEESVFQIGRLKYSGGGDWYNDPSAEMNLLKFVNENTSIKVKPDYIFVEANDPKIFNYPFLFITGHGNIKFSESEISNIRKYIERGGFIYIDDDYSLDKAVRREFKKIFPENNFIELPFSHEIYHTLFQFEYGPPKIHEHDKKPPRGFGLFVNGRMSVYYTFESNPSDGWADQRIHNDDETIRRKALEFGTNIIVWALTN